MGFTKHGVGEILPERDDEQTKTASKNEPNWTEQDQRQLDTENAEADQ